MERIIVLLFNSLFPPRSARKVTMGRRSVFEKSSVISTSKLPFLYSATTPLIHPCYTLLDPVGGGNEIPNHSPRQS